MKLLLVENPMSAEIPLAPLLGLDVAILLLFVLGLLYRRGYIRRWVICPIAWVSLSVATAFGIQPLSPLSFVCGFSLWLGPVCLGVFLLGKMPTRK